MESVNAQLKEKQESMNPIAAAFAGASRVVAAWPLPSLSGGGLCAELGAELGVERIVEPIPGRALLAEASGDWRELCARTARHAHAGTRTRVRCPPVFRLAHVDRLV